MRSPIWLASKVLLLQSGHKKYAVSLCTCELKICQKIPRGKFAGLKGINITNITNLNRFCQMPSKMSMHKLHSYQQYMRFPPNQLLSSLENYTLCYFEMTNSKTFLTGHFNSNQDPNQITLVHLHFFLTFFKCLRREKNIRHTQNLQLVSPQILGTLTKSYPNYFKRHRSELCNKARLTHLNPRKVKRVDLLCFICPLKGLKAANKKISNHTSGQISLHKIITTDFIS